MRFLLWLAACSAPASSPIGVISVNQMETQWVVAAAFSERAAPYGSACIHSAGACSAFDNGCGRKLPAAPPTKRLSAGTLSVGPATLKADSDKSYQAVNQMGVAFGPGTTVSVSASGADVPAFSGSLTMPAPATLTDLDANVPRDHDLVVSWSGGSAGAKLNLLLFSVTLDPTIQINCAFDAAGTSGSVPASLLQLIPAGADGHWQGSGVEIDAQPAAGITLQGLARVTGFGSSTFN